MSWRIQLTNRIIHQLHFLPAQPSLLAVWVRRNRVLYLQAGSGALVADISLPTLSATVTAETIAQTYRTLLESHADVYLPNVPLVQGTVYFSADGQMQLLHDDQDELRLYQNGKEALLKFSENSPLALVALHSANGIIAALETNGTLHLYRQQRRIGAFPLGLSIAEASCSMCVTNTFIAVTNGQTVVIVNLLGKEVQRWQAYPSIGRMAAAADGSWLVLGDAEGVLRIHDRSLRLVRQVYAFDVLEQAAPLQLLADLPPPQTGISQIAVSDTGYLAFALSGMVCILPLLDSTRRG